MKHPSLEISSGAAILSHGMRAIRKMRGKTAQEVATLMEMPLRTYEEFEAGRGPLTHERIFVFAKATNCDPFGLILSATFGLQEFAIDCADNKLALIMMMHLEEFALQEGCDIAYLDPPNLIGGFQKIFKEFSAKLGEREAFMQKWLDQRPGSIDAAVLDARRVTNRPRRR